MILTQRQIHHGVFGLVTVGGLLLLISSLATALNTREIVTILIGTVLSDGLMDGILARLGACAPSGG